jgi:hypothetical protein
MGVINTGSFAKALWPGVSTWVGEGYKEYAPEWPDLFDSEPSTKAYDEDVSISGFGLAEEVTEGGKTPYDEAKQAFVTRYINKTYRKGFIVTMEAMDDNQYNIEALGKKKAQALGFSMRQTEEILGANVYNRAFTSGYNFGDGVRLCFASHPLFGGGTFANVPSVAADLSEASLEQACIDIAGFTNDRGLLISVMPQKLIVPKELIFEAHRILNSVLQSDSANNNVNALRAMNIFPGGAVVNHYLTDSDAWFIRTNCPEGMKHKQRKEVTYGLDNDSDTFNAKFYAFFRASWGNTDPRGLYGSAGA